MLMHSLSRLLSFRETLVDLLFPRRCCGCGRGGTFLCDQCFKSIPLSSIMLCPGCLQSSSGGLPCAGCVSACPLDRLWVACPYREPLATAVHWLKYHQVMALTPMLASLLLRCVTHLRHQGGAVPEFSAVVPVPMHRRRLRERGKNHAAVLAQAFCQQTGWRYSPEWLARRRFTAPQVKLSAHQRRRNLAGAFAVPLDVDLRGRHPLLLDDVVTSGATLRECAASLKAAGAATVSALALAHR